MSLPLQNMCRTCMLNESKQDETFAVTQMVSILTVPEDSKEELSLMELLKTTAPQLKIKKNDQLPKIVCLECSNKIKEIYRFQQNCINVEQKYFKMLEKHEFSEPFNDSEEDIADILKTELGDPFDDENFLQSDNSLLPDDVKMEAAIDDLSADFDWDNKSESDWEEEKKPSKSKITMKLKTHTNEVVDGELFKVFRKDDGKGANKLKTTKRNSTARAKPNGAQQMYPCDKCNRNLTSELSLKKHREMHDEKDKEERRYECNICNKVFGKGSHLKEHTRSHIGEKPYLCSECGKGFATSGSLKQHTFRHLSRNQFPCPDCPRSFATKADLFSHASIHVERLKKNVCDICGRGFKKPFLLKQHKMYHNNERPFACEFCEKSFVTKEKCKRHTRIHTGEKPFKCTYCEKAYTQSSELIKHLRCHLGDNVYQCELCPLRFPSVKVMREHFAGHKNDDEETRARNLAELNATDMKGVYYKYKPKRVKKPKTRKTVKNDNETPKDAELKPPKIKKSAKAKPTSEDQQMYPCDKCNRTMKSELSFKKHKELHDKIDTEHQIYSRKNIDDRPFLCSDCGKGFTTAYGLKEHSFRHLTTNTFQCPDCPRSFTTKGSLNTHCNNIHKALPKKFECEFCGRGFKTTFLLKQHKRYHTNDKPFACEFCEKRFVTKDKVKRHTRIHTGEKPYKCQYCGNAYCQSNELIKHLHCHLGENIYQCELCPLRFPTVKIVIEHFSTHNNDDEETKVRNLAELNAVEVKGISVPARGAHRRLKSLEAGSYK